MNDNATQHAPRGESLLHPSAVESAATRDAGRARVYGRHLRGGDLAFDIGANCGEVTAVMLALGACVVAVEPQPEVARLIDPKAEVVVAACGAAEGEATFYAVTANPYLSTLRPDIRDAAVQTNASWGAEERRVPVVTLDGLIDRYGLPAFCKIDVEGFEVEVLQGLSQPLPALSFEVHSFDTGKIQACVDLLDSLGDYGYLYSRGESYELEPFPPHTYAWFGDVYATLRSESKSGGGLL